MSQDRGQTGRSPKHPRGTAGSGIFSIAMPDGKFGVVVGGNYEKPNVSENTLAVTHTATAVLGRDVQG